jgi:hypothetical protein
LAVGEAKRREEKRKRGKERFLALLGMTVITDGDA